ncbi:MAG: transposase [Defluviitaleaceae bacterium]|nr:transposase [Defluviitaleaceae bacterium]
MIKTYTFKLYRSKRNRRLHDDIYLAGKIYNHCIALHKRYYKIFGKYLSANTLKKHITKLKKTAKFSSWKALNSQAIQDIAERIDRGYQLFFRNLKRKVRTNPPTFKKLVKYKSFTLKQTGYKLYDNTIEIKGVKYKYSKSREISGEVKMITVKRSTTGSIHIFIVCKQPACRTGRDMPSQVLARTGKMVGFDFGLKTFLTASDGCDIVSPLFFDQNSKLIAKLNRELSHKKKGSNNRKKARLRLAKAHERIANLRKDFHFKLASYLCSEYAFIFIEDLNIKAMQRLWGKKISDLSHSKFVQILKSQAVKFGTTVVEIPRFFPSSKTCSNCDYRLEELPLSQRSWVCPNCGVEHDRDFNAATNILRVGASTLGRDTVRLALVS